VAAAAASEAWEEPSVVFGGELLGGKLGARRMVEDVKKR
jgi:hypothetical protein